MYVCVFFRSYGKEREREGERERDRERNKRAREMLTGVTDVREWWHTRTRMFPQIAFATPIRSRPFPPPSGSLSSPPPFPPISPLPVFSSPIGPRDRRRCLLIDGGGRIWFCYFRFRIDALQPIVFGSNWQRSGFDFIWWWLLLLLALFILNG